MRACYSLATKSAVMLDLQVLLCASIACGADANYQACAAQSLEPGGACHGYYQACQADGAVDPPSEGDASWTSSLAIGSDCCFDYSGDGTPDNGFGSLLGTLGSFLGDVDVDTLLQDAIDEGTMDLVLVLDGGLLVGLAGGSDSTLDDKVSGGGAFWSLADPSGQPDQVLAVPVTVEGDQLAGSGGTFDLPLSFGGGPLAMHDVKVAGTLQQGPSGFAIVDGQLGGVMGLEGLVTGLNTLSEQCPCLGLAAGQALFELKAEDKLGCTAALNGASPSCTAGDAAICSTIADNKGLFCTAIGIIKPDIDTDASGKADAFSIGLTFTSVPAAYLGLAEGAESTWGVDVFGGGCGGADGPATGAMALLALWVLARRRRLFGPVR